MADYWSENLQTASLDGVEFPLMRLARSGGRRFARHRYPYRDGQDTEDMGREPLAWDLVVPLFRGMTPLRPGVLLYPDVYESLRFVLDDPETRGEVEFVDPEIGPIQVKVAQHTWELTSDRRNGGFFRIRLEERSDTPYVYSIGIVEDPELTADTAAADLDEQLPVEEEEVVSAWSSVGVPVGFDFAPGALFVGLSDEFFDDLAAGARTAQDLAAQVDVMRTRIDRLTRFPAMRDPLAWEAYQSAIRLQDSLTQAAAAAQLTAPRLITFVTPWEMSFWEVATILYSDRARGPEVALRNPARNPLLYPPGTTLRVLDS